MAIYKNQTLLTIYLDTLISLSGASSVSIIYEKPDDTTGEWTSTVNGTKIVYQIQSGDLNMSGKWKLQPKVVIGGNIGYGEVKPMIVSDPI